MTALSEARAHLRKAREYLEAAELSLDLELFNAATSSAVSAGINAKDAICLVLTGRTGKTENHQHAVRELRDAGPQGRALEHTFQRLLGLKSVAQYQSADVSPANARRAVEWAERMVEAAKTAVAA